MFEQSRNNFSMPGRPDKSPELTSMEAPDVSSAVDMAERVSRQAQESDRIKESLRSFFSRCRC